MKKHLIILALVMAFNSIQAQQPLTPEKLWELHRVNGIGITPDQQYVLVSVSTPNIKENTFNNIKLSPLTEAFSLASKTFVHNP